MGPPASGSFIHPTLPPQIPLLLCSHPLCSSHPLPPVTQGQAHSPGKSVANPTDAAPMVLPAPTMRGLQGGAPLALTAHDLQSEAPPVAMDVADHARPLSVPIYKVQPPSPNLTLFSLGPYSPLPHIAGSKGKPPKRHKKAGRWRDRGMRAPMGPPTCEGGEGGNERLIRRGPDES
jgi:hypothetical protein